jgi:hypothetical protein
LVHPSEHRSLIVEEIGFFRGIQGKELLQAMQTCREATVLHYAPAVDPHLHRIAELADLVFCIHCELAPAKGRKAEARMPGAQRTLEAYS